MATFSKIPLSASSGGRVINVQSNSNESLDTIHTCSTSTTVQHEVWLYASNESPSDSELTIAIGTDQIIEFITQTITAKSGLILVIPGLTFNGNSTPIVIKAFAGTSGVINITGYVNVITQ